MRFKGFLQRLEVREQRISYLVRCPFWMRFEICRSLYRIQLARPKYLPSIHGASANDDLPQMQSATGPHSTIRFTRHGIALTEVLNSTEPFFFRLFHQTFQCCKLFALINSEALLPVFTERSKCYGKSGCNLFL